MKKMKQVYNYTNKSLQEAVETLAKEVELEESDFNVNATIGTNEGLYSVGFYKKDDNIIIYSKAQMALLLVEQTFYFWNGDVATGYAAMTKEDFEYAKSRGSNVEFLIVKDYTNDTVYLNIKQFDVYIEDNNGNINRYLIIAKNKEEAINKAKSLQKDAKIVSAYLAE